MIIRLVEKYHVPRSPLVLEIMESAIMNDLEQALGVLNALDDHGLMLSIDDYEIGYSSMSYLKKMPVKELKIDKAFGRDVVQGSFISKPLSIEDLMDFLENSAFGLPEHQKPVSENNENIRA